MDPRNAIRQAAACTAFLLAAAAAVLQAHHSLTGIYDQDVTASVDGRIREFHFVNPHPYVTVTVEEKDGAAAEWRLDMDNRHELVAIGMTERTLMPGDRIVATGMRGRDEKTRLYIRRLDRPADGFWYEQVGASPRMR